jgi:hypothetical protein
VLRRFQPSHPRHENIHEDHVVGIAGQRGDGLGAAARDVDQMALAPKLHRCDQLVRYNILDKQHSRAGQPASRFSISERQGWPGINWHRLQRHADPELVPGLAFTRHPNQEASLPAHQTGNKPADRQS